MLEIVAGATDAPLRSHSIALRTTCSARADAGGRPDESNVSILPDLSDRRFDFFIVILLARLRRRSNPPSSSRLHLFPTIAPRDGPMPARPPAASPPSSLALFPHRSTAQAEIEAAAQETGMAPFFKTTAVPQGGPEILPHRVEDRQRSGPVPALCSVRDPRVAGGTVATGGLRDRGPVSSPGLLIAPRTTTTRTLPGSAHRLAVRPRKRRSTRRKRARRSAADAGDRRWCDRRPAAKPFHRVENHLLGPSRRRRTPGREQRHGQSTRRRRAQGGRCLRSSPVRPPPAAEPPHRVEDRPPRAPSRPALLACREGLASEPAPRGRLRGCCSGRSLRRSDRGVVARAIFTFGRQQATRNWA